jgi:hypothetical protein
MANSAFEQIHNFHAQRKMAPGGLFLKEKRRSHIISPYSSSESAIAGRGAVPRARNRRLLQLRLTFSTAAAVFFLFQSLNANFLRTPVASQNVFLHVCIAIFGVAWLVQSLVLVRQLYREDSR